MSPTGAADPPPAPSALAHGRGALAADSARATPRNPGPGDLADLALGQDVIDRRADLRAAGWSAVPDERRVILLDLQGEAAVVSDADGTAHLAEVRTVGAPGVPAGDAASGEPGDLGDIFLGVDAQGRAVCGRVVGRESPEVPEGAAWGGLRSVGLRLAADDRGILAEFLALANWHGTHTRCPRCGTATLVAGLGWWRTCPQDGSEHYPRTDPAVIAILVDGQGNALLGRQARWPQGAFSTLAGFVEPGESAESAVVREIAEEVGLRPTGARYVGSQPWPFPGSLMLGFEASIEGVRPDPSVDGTEIVEARWLSRAELGPACAARDVRLPGRLSIAHHLISRWYGDGIPEEWCRW